jgi:hypothetical protein
MRLEEHDRISLIEDIGEIKTGTEGTIVFDYGNGVFEVEFFDLENKTIGVIQTLETQIKKL